MQIVSIRLRNHMKPASSRTAPSNSCRTLVIAVGLLLAGYARTGSASEGWEVFDGPSSGNDLVRVCLVRHDGRWAEGDSNHPSKCREMLVAATDTHTLWPDQSFYLARQKTVGYGATEYNSDLFKFKLSVENDPDLTAAVLAAFAQSGAEERLDVQAANATASCSARYAQAATIEEVQDVDKTCHAYAGTAGREAYNKALGRQEAAQETGREALVERTQPKCSTVRISGIVVGAEPQALDGLRHSSSAADIIARHPLQCGPSGFTQTFVCKGATVLTNQAAHIIAWSDTSYQVATPVDLTNGRKDALLYVSRADATCQDATKPSLDFSTNLQNFLRHYNANR